MTNRHHTGWGLLASLMLLASATAPAPDAPAPTSAAMFEEVWQRFAAIYPSFEIKGVDWDAVRAQHAGDFAAELSPEQFADALALVLSELRDSHINVIRPDGTYVPVYLPPMPANFPSTPRNRYAAAPYTSLANDVIRHGWLVGEVGYMRIDSFETAAFAAITDADLETLFATYATARGLIIDARANMGGNELNAMAIAGRLIDAPIRYGSVRTRADAAVRNLLSDHLDKVLPPSAGTHYSGRVAVLIGPRNMSSAEWFALMMMECPTVTAFGDRTRGSSGNPASFVLANGVTYTVPQWIGYRPDGMTIEDNGVTPDVVIPAAESVDGTADYVVQAALDWLATTSQEP